MWDNILIVAIVTAVVGLAAWYVIRAKRRGIKCIGCSACNTKNGGDCSGGCCGCPHTKHTP